jgi:hypothetical protein
VRIVFLLAILGACLAAQGPDSCQDALAPENWDTRPSSVYAEAVALRRELNARGFRVNCIRRSKEYEEALFEGQQGVAWFRTDKGVFVAWLLPKTQSFEGLEVISQSNGGDGFFYSFKGMPRIATTISSSAPILFVPHGNVMFEVVGNEQLAASLKQAFQIP